MMMEVEVRWVTRQDWHTAGGRSGSYTFRRPVVTANYFFILIITCEKGTTNVT